MTIVHLIFFLTNSTVVYEEWAKAHGLSVNSLLVLCAINDGGDDCTQKKISQRWLIPKQTIHMVFKDFERRGFVELFPNCEKQNYMP